MSCNKLLILILIVAPACGDDAPSGPAPIELSLTATVPAGGEIFRCKYITLPDQDLDIETFEHEYTVGSHHILLYPTSLTPEQADAVPSDFDCNEVGELGQTGLAYGASEEPIGSQSFPPRVALKLGRRQVVLLEAHYLNTTDAELEATVVVRLFPAAEPAEIAAGNLFFYNYSILVPPAPGVSTSAMSCEIPAAINLQFAASHMHRRGTHYASNLIDPSGASRVLHETDDWESAEPDAFAPALTIAGGSRIDFSCHFRNDMPFAVTEGESAETNEMCMFIASYWPQQPEIVESCGGGNSGPVLDGAVSCLQTLECLETAESELATQECMAATCADSAFALNGFLHCLLSSGCTDDVCVETQCGGPYLSCERAGCAASR